MQRPDPLTLKRHQDIPHPDVMLIEAQRSLQGASAQLVHYNFLEPPDHQLFGADTYRLDLGLNARPGNSLACYEEYWPSNRFERVGSVFLLPPDQVLRGKSDTCGSSSSLVLDLQKDAVHRWLERELEWSADALANTLNIQDAHLHRLLLRLAQELRFPGFANEALTELLTAELSIEIARYCMGVQQRPGDRGLSAARLRLIDERLRAPGRAPTVSELANLCQLSERQLARGFKRSRGCSIGTYVANYQLDRAKALLAGGESVKAIAFELGFASTSSFCFAFRRSAGMSPKEYRENVLRQK